MRNFLVTVLMTAGLFGSGSAWADKLTLQCQILSGAKKIYGAADQVSIDPDNNYAELRVARTMGTNDEEKWDFTTQKKPGIDDHFSVKQFSDDGRIFGGGIRAASGEAFELVDGILTWTALYDGKVDTMRWRCR